MNKFTLEQLAHFDRCLFPDDAAEAIGRLGGYSSEETLLWQLAFRQRVRTRPLSVIDLYQEWIQDERFCKALEAYLVEFCDKS